MKKAARLDGEEGRRREAGLGSGVAGLGSGVEDFSSPKPSLSLSVISHELIKSN